MTEITDRVRMYRDSGDGWDDLRSWLAGRSYPAPERYSEPRDPSDDLVSYTDGTWDEVRRCRNIGLLTQAEYMAIVREADETRLRVKGDFPGHPFRGNQHGPSVAPRDWQTTDLSDASETSVDALFETAAEYADSNGAILESFLRDQAEMDAVEFYAGSGYMDVNTALRAGDELSEFGSAVEGLDAAISNGALVDDVVVYRGFGDFGLSVGDGFTDSGYVSTSLIRDIAVEFMPRENGWLAEIIVPRETSALYVDASHAAADMNFAELLLGRGESFKVLSVDEQRRQVKMMLVPRRGAGA